MNRSGFLQMLEWDESVQFAIDVYERWTCGDTWLRGLVADPNAIDVDASLRMKVDLHTKYLSFVSAPADELAIGHAAAYIGNRLLPHYGHANTCFVIMRDQHRRALEQIIEGSIV